MGRDLPRVRGGGTIWTVYRLATMSRATIDAPHFEDGKLHVDRFAIPVDLIEDFYNCREA